MRNCILRPRFKNKCKYEDSFLHLNTFQLLGMFNIHPRELSEGVMKADY